MTITKDSKQIVLSNNTLLEKVLNPYKEDCHYLQSAFVRYSPSNFTNQRDEDGKHKILLLAEGKFSIPHPCYIMDTGHFNAVEFNICYNQLAYYLLAECVQHKLLEGLKMWDMEVYSHRQLSDILIAKFSSSFQKPICSDRFEGYVEIKKILKKENMLFIKTDCGFNDNYGGSAKGNVLFVILNPEKK